MTKPILALIPEESTIQQIFKIRNKLLKQNWVSNDSRINTLPHISLVYSNSNIFTAEKLIADCNASFNNLPKTSLKILDLQTWDNKISTMFDPLQVSEYSHISANIFNRHNILDKTTNPSQIGDHMKIARNIFPDKIKNATAYIQSELHSSIIFNQIVLIDYDCTEKDILWKTNLK